MKNPKEELADEVCRILLSVGAVIENDHFVYQSKRHGSIYISHKDIYINPHVVSKLAFWLAGFCYVVAKNRVDVILSPTNGVISLGQWLAYYLAQLNEKRILALWAVKEKINQEEKFVLPVVFEKYLERKNVLVVDDIVTTGDTLKNLMKLCQSLGVKVVACACLWNRGNIAKSDYLKVPLISLIERKLEDWDEEKCPLCQSGIPINTDYGHGAEFLKELKEFNEPGSYDPGGES